MTRFCILATLVAAGCREPLTATPVVATVRVVAPFFESVPGWPDAPIALGGSKVVVRGQARMYCTDHVVSAVRTGYDISVEMTTPGTKQPCFAIASWDPWEIELQNLEPGVYTVRARVEGHKRETTTSVVLTGN